MNLFDAGLNLLSSFSTQLLPVSQVALSESFILATSSEDALAVCIPVDGSPVQSVKPLLGLGLLPAVDGNMGVCGATESTFLKLIDLSANPPAVVGATANAQFALVTTIGISLFGTTGHGGGGTQGGGVQGGGSGGHGGGSGGHGGGVPAGGGSGNLLTRPFGLRAIMISVGLKPERGLRIIRPVFVSVNDFAVRAFEEITRFTE